VQKHYLAGYMALEDTDQNSRVLAAEADMVPENAAEVPDGVVADKPVEAALLMEVADARGVQDSEREDGSSTMTWLRLPLVGRSCNSVSDDGVRHDA
jgi:hypothetical protein